MRPSQYEEIVLKAMSYIKTNISGSLSAPGIAENVGFSERHLRSAFKKVLNQNIVGVLQSERVGRAKHFLLSTNLEVTKVAHESGFNNYANFVKVFHEKTGLAPTEFRKKAGQTREMPQFKISGLEGEKKEEWYKDPFLGAELGNNWREMHGEWRNENGTMVGTGINNDIAFQKPLPENCSISFDVMLDPIPDLSSQHVRISLTEATGFAHCAIVIGTQKSSSSSFSHGAGGTSNSAARINEGEWHNLRLEIRDTVFRFFINEKEVFFIRDAMPIAYSKRCLLQLSSWHSTVRFRNFLVQNLGFSAVIHPIQRGDTLFTAGLYEKALEFYLRYLQAGSTTDAETMELRYKIGLCQLQLGAFSQAQNWFDKVVALCEDTFWAEQARLGFLELCYASGDLDGLNTHIPLCLKDAKTYDQARAALHRMIENFYYRGFFEEILGVLEIWSQQEQPGGDPYWGVQSMLAEHLHLTRQHAAAKDVLQKLIQTPAPQDSVLFARINLMQLYHEWGKFDLSEELRSQIESDTKDRVALIRCALQRAFNLRAKGILDEALKVLEEIPDRFGHDKSHFLYHARIHSALILCCLGRMDGGRNVLDEVYVASPSSFAEYWYYLPFCLAEKNYKAAADALHKRYQTPFSIGVYSKWAEEGIKAGILHELAGMGQEARSIFKDVSARFPNEHVRFFGLLGHFLGAGGDFDVTQMPYEAHRRSEMFYLIGLLMEKRGEEAAAQGLFNLCMKEDPALRWPAFMAKHRT